MSTIDGPERSDVKLVIGANGYLGAHVTRQLVEQGHTVRAMTRPSADLRGLDGVDVEHVRGDIFDTETVRQAMTGCSTVYYCVVDTRAWLRDPAPLFRTNVEGLRHVLEVAVTMPLDRFVFTSSIATIALKDGIATEDDHVDDAALEASGPYVQSRVLAERLLMEYVRDRGLPGVAMCVGMTYGPGDYVPTPHGGLVARAANGKMPFHVTGLAQECVCVEDSARALVLAGERGRIGERYIISERFIEYVELYNAAADAIGTRRPRFAVPRGVMYALGLLGDVWAAVTRTSPLLSREAVRLLHVMPAMDHGKATRELGWEPRPVTEAAADAARFYQDQRAQRVPAL